MKIKKLVSVVLHKPTVNELTKAALDGTMYGCSGFDVNYYGPQDVSYNREFYFNTKEDALIFKLRWQ